MNRRGFLGAFVGLAGAAVLAPALPVQALPVRHQVINLAVEREDLAYDLTRQCWLLRMQGEHRGARACAVVMVSEWAWADLDLRDTYREECKAHLRRFLASHR